MFSTVRGFRSGVRNPLDSMDVPGRVSRDISAPTRKGHTRVGIFTTIVCGGLRPPADARDPLRERPPRRAVAGLLIVSAKHDHQPQGVLMLYLKTDRRPEMQLFLIDGFHRRVIQSIYARNVIAYDDLRPMFPRVSSMFFATVIERASKLGLIRKSRAHCGTFGYFVTPLGLRILDSEPISTK